VITGYKESNIIECDAFGLSLKEEYSIVLVVIDNIVAMNTKDAPYQDHLRSLQGIILQAIGM
jgi:hypothetical protein